MSEEDDNNSITEREWENIYKECIKEGQESVKRQTELLEINRKSSEKLFQANVTLLGLILTALSVAGELEGFDAGPFLNPYLLVGLVFLLFSIGGAAIIYRPIEQTIGISGDDLVSISNPNEDPSREITENMESNTYLSFYQWLVSDYGERIEMNFKANVIKSLITSTAMLFLFFAITFFTLGVIEALSGQVDTGVLFITVVFLAIMTWISGVPKFFHIISHLKD